METKRSALICLVSTIISDHREDWHAAFESSIRAVGMTPVDYTSEAVPLATCMLAFVPGGEGEVLYEAAFASGRGLPVVYVVSKEEENLLRLDPKPTLALRIDVTSPNAISTSKPHIESKLRDLVGARPPRVVSRHTSRTAPAANPPPAGASSARRSLATSVSQGEALLQAFLDDGMSERLVERLLLDAGCPPSWVDFRLQQHFGTW